VLRCGRGCGRRIIVGDWFGRYRVLGDDGHERGIVPGTVFFGTVFFGTVGVGFRCFPLLDSVIERGDGGCRRIDSGVGTSHRDRHGSNREFDGGVDVSRRR
jgi:hypothetical protein